jgi:hypothetical protein
VGKPEGKRRLGKRIEMNLEEIGFGVVGKCGLD